MAKIQESPALAVSEMENIIREYRERINQALETESGKLREKAELDSIQIIAHAKEEAGKIVAEARRDTKVESERIIAGAKDEAEKITRESRKESAEARQESVRVIDETRKKALQIITEIVGSSATQAQNELVRAASEAKSKISNLLTQVNKGIEQIIDETRTNSEAEFDRLAAVIAEAETKLQELGDAQDKEEEVNYQRATGETSVPEAPVNNTELPVTPSGDKRGAPVKESDETGLLKGSLRLEVVPPFDQERTGGVPEWLSQFSGLRIVSTDSYARANRWITAYNINLEQPAPLVKILKRIPQVRDVAEHKGSLVVTLK